MYFVQDNFPYSLSGSQSRQHLILYMSKIFRNLRLSPEPSEPNALKILKFVEF
jgi:hypothetical protein